MRTPFLYLIVASTLVVAPLAHASLTATVNEAGGSGYVVVVNPSVSRSFSIDVNVSVAPETIVSSEMLLTAGTSGVVEIVGGSYGADWDATWSLPIPTGALNPDSSARFGAVVLSAPGETPRLTGDSRLVTLDLEVVDGTAPGDYTLTLTDFAVGEADSFDDIGGQSGVEFTITVQPADAPTIVSAVSRKTHGTAGAFDVDLLTPPSGRSVSVENRAGGPTLVVVGFDVPIQGVGGLDVADVALASTGMAGTITDVAINETELSVQITGATSPARVELGFPGIAHADSEAAVAEETLCFGVLVGDANGDESVNIFDLVTVRNSLNMQVSASNFRSDANADGSINIFDLVSTRNNLNTATGGECP
ncbi:MAG: hypothetical protein GXY55_20220 [Phycisphaerae bacterium]|nr:hypothetical protein [Phycisphaerae bacterium]